jgi:competence protein ComEC
MPGYALTIIVLGGLWLCIWREKWRYIGLLPILIGMMYPLYTPTPDFFVSDDGKEWAARLDDGRLAVSNLDHDKFAVTQWQQRLGNIESIDVSELPTDFAQMRCDDMGCVYRKNNHILAVPLAEPAMLEDCEYADIVVVPVVVKQCAAHTIIDEPALWFHGAHVIYFKGDDVRVESARTTRGARPWSVGWGRKQAQSEHAEE